MQVITEQQVKQRAMAQVLEQGKLISEVADELGIGKKTLFSWISNAQTPVQRRRQQLHREIAATEQKLNQLKQQLQRL